MGKFGNCNSNKYCSVPECKSRCTNEISLFFFPKEEALRKRWADAIKIEKEITQHMQVCSRHFVKSDYVLSDYPGTAKVRRLKKSAVPSQNLPWQFPNKHVSPMLAQARMERLKNRTQQKIATPSKNEANKSEPDGGKAVKNKNPADDETDDEKSEGSSDDDEKSDEDKDNSFKEKDVMVAIHDTKSIKNNEKAVEAKKEDTTMVSRGPTRLRQQTGVLKCEYCGRKCLTPQALRTHQQIAHKNAKSDQSDQMSPKKTMNKPKEAGKATPVSVTSVKQVSIMISSKPSPKVNIAEKPKTQSDLVERVIKDFDDSLESDSSDTSGGKEPLKQKKSGRRKIEFECPKCKKRFAVYFSAMRHIHKYHSREVTSAEEIKPERVEICTICNLVVVGDVHVCVGPLKLSQGLVCTGCNQEFRTFAIFDMHKSGMHSEGVESMFFPTLDEFEDWKAKMEKHTKSQYSMLDQNDTKKVHRCAHRVVKGQRPHMCPSSIIVQEFARGFQVHYYPKHFGHAFEPYDLSEDFKKYSIASLMNFEPTPDEQKKLNEQQRSDGQQKPNEQQGPDESDEDIGDDLYIQYKKLTDILVNEAARINVNGLKKLMRKALDMVNIVISYEEDDDDMSSTLNMNQDDDDLQERIKRAFKSFKKSGQLKRKALEALESPPKKKPVFQNTENTIKDVKLKVQPVRVVNPLQTPKVKDEIENLKEPKKETPDILKTNNQSPSFLDSFNEFVGKTLVKPAPEKRTRSEKKKQVVKTKMGQFKQSPTKKDVPLSPKTNSVSPKTNPVSPKTNSVSPKTNSVSTVKNINKKSSFIKDIKYEVKEQENDCNILILKI